jgi:hypothetical protein
VPRQAVGIEPTPFACYSEICQQHNHSNHCTMQAGSFVTSILKPFINQFAAIICNAGNLKLGLLGFYWLLSYVIKTIF